MYFVPTICTSVSPSGGGSLTVVLSVDSVSVAGASSAFACTSSVEVATSSVLEVASSVGVEIISDDVASSSAAANGILKIPTATTKIAIKTPKPANAIMFVHAFKFNTNELLHDMGIANIHPRSLQRSAHSLNDERQRE